jgi:hypothetical protein
VAAPGEDAAVLADRVHSSGSVFLAGARVGGQVRMAGAEIGGSLLCPVASFASTSGPALVFDTARIRQDVILRSVYVEGEIRLLGAEIGGQFLCEGSVLRNPDGDALSMHHAVIKGAVFLDSATGDSDMQRRDFYADGAVRLNGAEIGGPIQCNGAHFLGALSLEQTRVTLALMMRELRQAPASLNLAAARVHTLVDDGTAWPAPGGLGLDGFRYELLADDTHDDGVARDAQWRLRWLRLQPPGQGLDAYTHLAAHYRTSGRPDFERTILTARQHLVRSQLSRRSSAWWSNQLLDWLVGYGWRMWPYVLAAALLPLLGWYVVELARDAGAFALNPELPENANPQFSGLLYSLDIFLPAVDFGQEKAWVQQGGWYGHLRAASRAHLLGIYLALHQLAGWAILAVLFAWFSGLIRRNSE